MSITMQLLLVALAASLCLSEGAGDGRVARAKQQRPTRGFKNVEMMTARGFGKRGRTEPYGLENFWEAMESGTDKEGQDTTDDKKLESIPMEWLVLQIMKNPDFAQSVVRKFVDVNQDGQLSTEELFREVV